MSLRSLSDTQRRNWIRLVRTPNIGPLTFARLMERFGAGAHALAAMADIASRIELPTASAIEDELAATQRCGAHLIVLENPAD